MEPYTTSLPYNHSTVYPPEDPPPFIFILLGVLNVLIGFTCLFFNYIVFTFYFKRRKKFLPIIYCSLSFTDLTMGVSALINSITLFTIPYKSITTNYNTASFLLYWLPLHFFSTSLSCHVTVYKNVILSVMRTINIKLPFYRVSKTSVIIAVFIYPLIWAPISLYEIYYWFEKGGHNGKPLDVDALIFYFVYLPCTGSGIMIKMGVPDVIIELISIGVPFVIPSLICMVCCAIQSHALLKRNVTSCDENMKRQQQITVTIFQVTVVFCVCNTVYFVTAIYLVLRHHEDMTVYWVLLYLTGTTLPFVNSLLNPIILIRRSKVLNEFMLAMLNLKEEKERNEAELERDGGLVMMNIMSIGTTALDPVENTMNCVLDHVGNPLGPLEEAETTCDSFSEFSNGYQLELNLGSTLSGLGSKQNV